MLDTYSIKARLQPVLLVALPGALAAIAWLPEIESAWTFLSVLVAATGVPALLSQLGRDRGRRMQTELWDSWGGPPTTRLLRHRDAPNKHLLERRHRRLRELMDEFHIPSPAEELANPEAADQVYEACADFLRSQTRDVKQFDLLFRENCSYGFRRNLWGLKPLGLAIAIIGFAAVGGLIILNVRDGDFPSAITLVSSLGNLLLLGLWLFVITPDWVRIPADAYAQQLLSACERISVSRG